MSQLNDLSAYEKLRLENIRRNAYFLMSMGIQPLESKQSRSIAHTKPLPRARDRKKLGCGWKRRRTERSKLMKEEQPTRRSRRLSLSADELKLEDETEYDDQEVNVSNNATITYQGMPMESFDLDDYEFQLFVVLRSWRLRRCRELDIEPYKIFQNRTMAEIIRRRRNDGSWANCKENAQSMAKDLLQCWGIGPAKAASGSFGWEVMNVIDNDSELLALLSASRERGDNFAAPPCSQ